MEEQRESAKNRLVQSKENERVSNKPVVDRREENDKTKSKLMSRMKEIRKSMGEEKRRKERGYGGNGLVIRRSIGYHKVEFINDGISYLKTNKLAVIGVI
ncbi:unnamed protein product [Brachionus calyciflorus]|uniref:Uncharacterized protein n=1 Tax=Brachionus calyciflorus TaxID=104777 RepID=A0A813M2L3_9BILA|nr:unnamed protein product [Brachionus calyciflorus]